MIDILGYTIHEPDVAITDFVLFVESVFFAYLLWRQKTTKPLLQKLFMLLFLSLAASSVLGAIFHALFPEKVATQGGFALWLMVTAAIGITASSIWCINALVLKRRNLFNIAVPFSVVYFLALIYAVAFISTDFITIVAFYVPPMIIFALISFFMFLRRYEKSWGFLLVGLILSFVAATIQFMEIGLHPVYFNHNALYHLIQAIALALIFIGGRHLLISTISSDKF